MNTQSSSKTISLYIYSLNIMKKLRRQQGHIIVSILQIRKINQKRSLACPKSPGNGAPTGSRTLSHLGSPFPHHRVSQQEARMQLPMEKDKEWPVGSG